MTLEGQQSVVIFIGPPGSGKGTLAHLCMGRLGWIQCSTGDLLRRHVAEKTLLGRQIDDLIKSGKLISDNLVIGLVEDWLSNHQEHRAAIILDGVPRTVAQARLLDELFSKDHSLGHAKKVIEMDVDDETVIRRLMSRLVCANRDCSAVYSSADLIDRCKECSAELMHRADDVEQVVRDRLVLYRQHAQDLLSYYQQQGVSVGRLCVDQPVEMVYEKFVDLMGLSGHDD